jgi:hypothetical protein
VVVTSKTIEIVVAPDGSTQVSTQGFAGAECQQASEFLKRSLGQTLAEHRTADYYRQPNTEQQTQQQAGQ